MKKCLAQPLPSRGGVCNFIMPNYHLTHNIMYARARTGLLENNLHLHALPRNALPAGFSGLCSPTRTFTEPSPVLHRGAPGRKRSPFFRKRSPFLQKRSPFFPPVGAAVEDWWRFGEGSRSAGSLQPTDFQSHHPTA